jgi:hypothetical protein
MHSTLLISLLLPLLLRAAELRKALAAQRLFLRDEAAALAAGPAGAKQLPMREQMLSRLAQIQDAANSR